MSVRYEAQGTVAVITLDNPPVNGLGHATRAGVVSGIERANERGLWLWDLERALWLPNEASVQRRRTPPQGGPRR